MVAVIGSGLSQSDAVRDVSVHIQDFRSIVRVLGRPEGLT